MAAAALTAVVATAFLGFFDVDLVEDCVGNESSAL